MSARDRQVQWMSAVAGIAAAAAMALFIWASSQDQRPAWALYLELALAGLVLLLLFWSWLLTRGKRRRKPQVAAQVSRSPSSSPITIGTQSASRDINIIQHSVGQARTQKDGRPRVVLHEKSNGFHVKRVAWPFGVTSVLGLRFINAPETDDEHAVAKGVRVRFTCQGPGLSLPWINARYDYSPQPSDLRPGELPVLAYDLGIDEWREVNLIIKEPESAKCYLFNNDSFNHPRAQKPDWAIPPGEYKAIVKVSGIGVRERFECMFTNPGVGGELTEVAPRERPASK